MKTYTSSIYKLLPYFIRSFFICAIINFFIFTLLLTNSHNLFFFQFGFCFIVGIIYAIFNYITITVNENEIVFLRFHKPFLTISLQEPVITSYIINHYINGIPSGKSLYVRVVHANGNQKDYKCNAFSKQNFQDLISDIYILRNTSNPVEDIENNDIINETTSTTVFKIPKDELLVNEYRRQTKLWMIFIVLSFIFIFGLYLFLSNAGINVFSSEMFTTFLMMITLILIMLIGIPFISFKKLLSSLSKETPYQITLEDTKVIIDDTKFHINQIQNMKVTPPSYNSAMTNQKRLMQFSYQGKSYVYSFGYTNQSLFYYEDYSQLCSHLEDVFKKQNQFIYDI